MEEIGTIFSSLSLNRFLVKRNDTPLGLVERNSSQVILFW